MIDLNAEAWLATRLGNHGAEVFIGLTDCDTRRERIRTAILEHGFECVLIGANERKPETYAQAFERVYAVPLTAPKGKTTRAAPSVSAPPKNHAVDAAPDQLSLGESA